MQSQRSCQARSSLNLWGSKHPSVVRPNKHLRSRNGTFGPVGLGAWVVRGEGDAAHTKATLCQLAIHLPRATGHFHVSMTGWVALPVLWKGVQTGHSLPRPHRRMAVGKVQDWTVPPLSPTLRYYQSTLNIHESHGLLMAVLAAGYGSRPICGCFTPSRDLVQGPGWEATLWQT